MTRLHRARLVLGVLGVCGLLLAFAGSAAGAGTAGTWGLYPAQTYTDASSTTYGSAYKSAVQAPINADGSSNFSAKRGVIAVQFNLLAAPTAITTTTRTYDPPVWKSIGSEGSVTVASFTPASSTLTFNDITNLSANYAFTLGTCGGGSLRWTIAVLHNGVEQNVHVYYGDPGGVQECTLNSGSGQNLITTSGAPNRFEMQGGFGGVPVYTTYAATQAVVGTDRVLAARLILDSGWSFDQRANVSSITVNDNTFVPKTTETTTTTTVTGPYARTCDLLAAELRWSKDDPVPDGAINEAESIQPNDAGQYYRQVDCKYVYNLAVSSLSGQGTYRTYVRINNQNLDAPAKFDLR